MRVPPQLVLLTPGNLDEHEGERIVRLVRACVEVGLEGVLLREPTWGDRVTLDMAKELRDVLGTGWLCIHDRVHLAESARADAVHLGWRSLEPRVARALVGPSVGIGFSSHAADEPSRYDPCDYLFFGPVRDTPSKRDLLAATGFDGLERAVKASRKPIWALGGMRPEDVAAALDAQAAGIAVLGGIVNAADPALACARYISALRARA
jgi:thiamine-phosphate diphosphorylase